MRLTGPRIFGRVGTLVELEKDTLVVEVEKVAEAMAVPLADLTKLEVRRGKKSRLGKGALIGGGVGAALGIALAADAKGGGHEVLSAGATPYVLLVPPAAVLGAGLGALVGLLIKTDRWEAIPLDELRIGPSPERVDALAVSVTLRL